MGVAKCRRALVVVLWKKTVGEYKWDWCLCSLRLVEIERRKEQTVFKSGSSGDGCRSMMAATQPTQNDLGKASFPASVDGGANGPALCLALNQ